MLRIPNYLDNRLTDGGKVVSWPPFTPERLQPTEQQLYCYMAVIVCRGPVDARTSPPPPLAV
jgi:hypothetical protein